MGSTGRHGTTLACKTLAEASSAQSDRVLDHIIVFNERHLRRASLLRGYYHRSRTHLAIDNDARRNVNQHQTVKIIRVPKVGGCITLRTVATCNSRQRP